MISKNEGKKTSLLEYISAVILAIGLVIAILTFVTTEKAASEESFTEAIEPYEVMTLADGSKEYYFDVHDYDSRYTCIEFYTSHQMVYAFDEDGNNIYSFDKTGGIWTSSPGSTFHFVEFNPNSDTVKVHTIPVYDCVKDQKLVFNIGQSAIIYAQIIQASAPRYVTSLLIVALGIALICSHSFIYKKIDAGKGMLYLGEFSLFMGIWSLNETDLCTLVTHSRIFSSIITYLSILLIVPTFVMFVASYLDLRDKYFYKIMLWLSAIQFVVLSILHFTKIREYKETLKIMQGILLLAGVYLIGAVVYKLIKKQYTRRLEVCLVGLGLFMVAMIADLVKYYQVLGDSDHYGRYVFLLFVVMMTADLVKETNEIINKGRRAKELEIFALTDKMTDMYNRNAYENHLATIASPENLAVVVADTNELKQCNDTYGHEMGDDYITRAAEIFSDVFGASGNCYRTGGDEFCCIVTDASRANIERLIRVFRSMIYTVNARNEFPFKFDVAIGYAKYDADKDIKALIKRADANMYENKRESKSF